MRILILTILASAVIGCGGEVQSNAATDNDDAAIVATCDSTQGTIQTIGEVPGYVFSLIGAGSNLYAVAATPDDGGLVSSTVGALYRVSANGAQVPMDNAVDPFNVASLGSTIGYMHPSQTSQGFYVDDAVEMIDANGAVTTIGNPGDVANNFSSLTTNGNAFMWLETQSDGSPNQPKSSAIATSAGSTSLVTSVGSGVLVTSNFVSDGAHVFGAFATNGADSVVGEIPMGDASSLVLDPTPGGVEEMAGVDDQNVYYVAAQQGAPLATLWSVPKSGSRPPTALASMQYGMNVVITKGNAYWLDPQSSQTNVMTVPLTLIDLGDAEQPVQTAYAVSASTNPFSAIAVDDCGLLLAESLSQTESMILRMPLE
jgi:hypothetical protein